MPQNYDAQYQQDVVELAKGQMDALTDGIKASLGLTPSGAAQPTDEELAAFFAHQNVIYPPQLFTYPDGHQVFASPWILSLEFAENGDQWVSKYTRFVNRNGGAL